MGKVMGAAFADIREKCDLIKLRSKEYNCELFFELVQKEIALDIH